MALITSKCPPYTVPGPKWPSVLCVDTDQSKTLSLDTYIYIHTYTHKFSRISTPTRVCSFPFLCPFRALANLADVLASVGLQEEAELPAPILAEFVVVSTR